MTDERLLTSKEVADRLKVSPRMVQKLAQTGELPRVRVGDLYRFRPVDVDDYIRLNRQPKEEGAEA